MNEVSTKYAVKLSILANSFYDPFSKANLFKTQPYYLFNHEPTAAIKTAIKGGRLVDIKGNIELHDFVTGATELKEYTPDTEAIKAQLRVELESEIRAEIAAEEAEKAEKKAKAEAKEEAKAKAKAKDSDK